MIIYLDMDGVIADFVGGLEKEFNMKVSDNYSWDIHNDFGMKKEEFWRRIDTVEFWGNLEMIKGSFEFYQKLKKFCSVYICTKPTNSPNCFYGKAIWLKNHFGGNFSNYIFIAKKDLLAHGGAVLIDDHSENIDNFRKFGGHGILVDRLDRDPNPQIKQAEIVEKVKELMYLTPDRAEK